MTCGDGDWPESPDQAVLFATEIAAVRAVLGARLPVADVLAALDRCGGNAERAINALLDGDADPSDDGDAERAIDALLDAEKARVKAERDVVTATPTPTPTPTPSPLVKVKDEPVHDVQMERPDGPPQAKGAPLLLPPPRRVKDEDEDEVTRSRRGHAGACGISLVPRAARADIDDVVVQIIDAPAAPPMSKKRAREEDAVDLTATHPLPYLNPRPIRAIPPQDAAQMYDRPPAPAPRRARATAVPPSSEWKMVVAPEAEFGDFPPESDWFLVEKSYVTGLSTHSGRRAMDAGEIVHFAFPSYGRLHGGVKVSAKKAAALVQIVRFSTKRAGEIGKLSTEWTKCLVPLVNSSKVKIQGKIVFPTVQLRLMQEVLLYVSFYIHKSVFTEGDSSSLSQLAPANVDYSDNPLHALFKLLKLRASIKADFTLDELTRKRPWNLRGDANGDDESTPIVGLETHRTAGQLFRSKALMSRPFRKLS